MIDNKKDRIITLLLFIIFICILYIIKDFNDFNKNTNKEKKIQNSCDKDNKDCVKRIDDFLMSPKNMFDTEDIRWNNLFMNLSTYEPNKKDLPNKLNFGDGIYREYIIATQKFHSLHCVNAFRRYLRFMENGVLQCQSDYSLSHMKHCLHILEENIVTNNVCSNKTVIIGRNNFKCMYD